MLEQFFNDKIKKAKAIDPSSVEMIELLKEFTLRGGKRIRAALIYYGYRSFKDDNEEEILKASMSIELAHAFLLIHDDIIDQDALRRSGPTIHTSYQNIFKSTKDPKHYGISFAILAGDILYAFANEILTSLNLPEKNKIKAIQIFNHIIHQVLYGESLDILSSIKTNFTSKDLEQVHYLKTATYTIEGPLHIGATLAGASQHHLKDLSKYAIPLGKAFQLQDDILGLFGEEKVLGKPIGSDLREGKKTLLIINALETASPSDQKTIQSILGNQDLTEDQIDKVREIVTKTGSLKISQDLVKQLGKEAKASISNTKLHDRGCEFLLGIADYLAERKY
ncbi:MAG: polyprenyl synthetase family protein [Candidatus Woesearchaeota archaeon]|nr:polyprenyl synthetase family protein [Candidatus Woesearchaeota archaeon]MDP7457769.1 polyprenyl synthetase family protein [Candidatus Woesearchaeota archaeon]